VEGLPQGTDRGGRDLKPGTMPRGWHRKGRGRASRHFVRQGKDYDTIREVERTYCDDIRALDASMRADGERTHARALVGLTHDPDVY